MKLFKRSPKKPKERTLYAITNGTMMGVCVMFINPNEYPKDGYYAAIAMGDKNMEGGMDALEIPELSVTKGLEFGILDPVQKIPKELYALCCSEYSYRVKKKQASFNTESTPNEPIN